MRFGVTTDLVIGDGILDIIHKFRRNLNVSIVSRATRRLDAAAQHHLKFVCTLIEDPERSQCGIANEELR